MTNIKMNISMLSAMAVVMPTKDIRFYLNGIFIDSRKKLLVATDGTCIAVGYPDSVLCEGLVDDVIMPCNFVKEVLSLAKARKLEIIEIILADGILNCNGLIAKVVDGRFPDWRRVYTLWKTEDGHPQLDAELVAKGYKMAKCMGYKRTFPMISHGARSTAWMNIDNKIHFGVMPLNFKPKDFEYSRFDV